MKHSRTLRLPAVAVTLALAGLVVAACGSSSNTGSASSGSSSSAAAASGAAGGANSAARAKLAACLKAHGVTLTARTAGARRRPPGGYGGYGGYGGAPGFFFGGGGGNGSGAPGAGRFNDPKFRAALKACGGGRFPGRRATLDKAAVTRFAACVKRHGYTLPAPNFSGKGPIFPASIERDKKFQAAAKACASDLRPQASAGAGGSGGAPPGSGSSSD